MKEYIAPQVSILELEVENITNADFEVTSSDNEIEWQPGWMSKVNQYGDPVE